MFALTSSRHVAAAIHGHGRTVCRFKHFGTIRTWPSCPAGDDYQKALIEHASTALGLTLPRRKLDPYDIFSS